DAGAVRLDHVELRADPAVTGPAERDRVAGPGVEEDPVALGPRLRHLVRALERAGEASAAAAVLARDGALDAVASPGLAFAGTAVGHERGRVAERVREGRGGRRRGGVRLVGAGRGYADARRDRHGQRRPLCTPTHGRDATSGESS